MIIVGEQKNAYWVCNCWRAEVHSKYCLPEEKIRVTKSVTTLVQS